MNHTNRHLILATLGSVLLCGGCAKKSAHLFSSLKDPQNVAQLKQFVAEKKSQADAATNAPAPGFAPFFAAAERGDWMGVSNAFHNLRNHAGQYEHSGATDDRLRGPRWAAAVEIWGVFDAFAEGGEKYSAAFGRDIIASIPPGSIYFGGTDPGRFVVTGMCKSQVTGDPFFVLTQNALADGGYLDYIRGMYGDKISLPDDSDSQRCFAEYTEDLKKRSEAHQLKPGENYHPDANGKAQISGQVAVMEINGLLAKTIVDRNPKADFYLEESFPLDWMYPQLEPHGLILKLNHQPAATLSDDLVQADHDYWSKYVQPMIGDWLKDDTSVADVAAFAEKTFARHDLSGFTGDPDFIKYEYAQKSFSKLRSSIAGLYLWRVDHASVSGDKERMAHAADFAFRQAWALCPYSPEAVYRYVNFLMEQKRVDDALLVAQTSADMPDNKGSGGDTLRSLIEQLKKQQGQN